MITNVDKRIAEALNKGEEYWTFKEDAERDYVHGLFAYPAMMVPKMQREILEAFSSNLPSTEDITIFDPFMGSGTILVEGMLRGYNIIGVDINPLAYLVAKVKTEIYSTKRLKRSIDNLLSRISKDTKVQAPTKFENIDKWFKPEITIELDIIKQEIRKEDCLKIRRFFWAVFSDTVRTVSNARSCTYKLYMKTEKAIDNYDKSPIDVFSEYIIAAYDGVVSFQNKLEKEGHLSDTRRGKKYKGSIDIHLANTIDVASQICEKYNPDLVITSPPYGDNETTVTYGQYSVLELRWMDLNDIGKGIDPSVIDSQSRIDRISMGGTIEKKLCAQQKTKIAAKSPTLHNQIEQIESADKNKVWKVISFYNDFDDFANTLSKLKSNAYLIMTVGNRTVAKQKIKMNEIMKELFAYYGFDFSFEFTRRIIRKRMSIINARDAESGTLLESMNKEYIIILKKR